MDKTSISTALEPKAILGNQTISKAFEPPTTYLVYDSRDGVEIMSCVKARAEEGSKAFGSLHKAIVAQSCREDGDSIILSAHIKRLLSAVKRLKKDGNASSALLAVAEIAKSNATGSLTGPEVLAIKEKQLGI